MELSKTERECASTGLSILRSRMTDAREALRQGDREALKAQMIEIKKIASLMEQGITK
jgi:hypothetical protein